MTSAWCCWRTTTWDHPDRVAHLVLANTLHSPEMWQANHQNINREIENQYPEVWQDISKRREAGELSSTPEMQALPRLAELRMPVLIFAGRFDRALYPRLQRDFRRCCPQAQFVMLERSGSFGHLEEPDTMMPILRQFLAPRGL